MRTIVDLHSHSGYAGGVGQISLENVSKTMKFKGIDIFGVGDVLLPARMDEIRNNLNEKHDGLFSLSKDDDSLFLLQTEVIFSTKLKGYRNKTIAHHIILFPNFDAIIAMQKLMHKWNMKNTIGRPFITSSSQNEVEDQLAAISNIDKNIEIIPAHVMTPEGILGSKNNLSSMSEFYGDFLPKISVVETGLSADPTMLETIPDLQNLTYISNSDCHSAALNRIGREFTALNIKKLSYPEIIQSLRLNNIDFTAEFNPKEGRFYNTGHRANRSGHSNFVYYEEQYPTDLICPICKKKMNLGVSQRAKELQDNTIKPRKRNYYHLIPLIEVIAFAQNIKSVTAKKVVKLYADILSVFDSEIALWLADEKDIINSLEKIIDLQTISKILSVKREQFSFIPAGFDGNYGKLKIQ